MPSPPLQADSGINGELCTCVARQRERVRRAASVTLDARELDELRQTFFYSASSTKLWHTVDVKENQFGRIFFFFFSSIGQRRKDCQVQQVVEIRLRI